jgi:GNAT superfamily N-acetyltransferase
MLKITPLTQEQLANAISLLEKIFSYKPDQRLFKYSLTDSLSKRESGQIYWIAVDKSNRVIGITGLYDDAKDKKASWLGWFGVHPNYRQYGTGSLLLQYAINQALQKGSTRLKLYTSSDPNELAAHKLYKKFGFRQTKFDRIADKIYFMKIL